MNNTRAEITTDEALALLDVIRADAAQQGDGHTVQVLERVTAHITDRVVLRLEVERENAALRAAAAEVLRQAERQRDARAAGNRPSGLSSGLDIAIRQLVRAARLK